MGMKRTRAIGNTYANLRIGENQITLLNELGRSTWVRSVLSAIADDGKTLANALLESCEGSRVKALSLLQDDGRGIMPAGLTPWEERGFLWSVTAAQLILSQGGAESDADTEKARAAIAGLFK